MATSAAIKDNFEPPDLKIKIVMNDYDPGRGNLIVGRNPAYGPAAQIHVWRRLDKQKRGGPEHGFHQIRFPLRFLQGHPGLFREIIQKHKTNIMSGLMIFTTRITQSGNQQHYLSPEKQKKTGKCQPSSGLIYCANYIAILNIRR
jgi:hypothetical protein